MSWLPVHSLRHKRQEPGRTASAATLRSTRIAAAEQQQQAEGDSSNGNADLSHAAMSTSLLPPHAVSTRVLELWQPLLQTQTSDDGKQQQQDEGDTVRIQRLGGLLRALIGASQLVGQLRALKQMLTLVNAQHKNHNINSSSSKKTTTTAAASSWLELSRALFAGLFEWTADTSRRGFDSSHHFIKCLVPLLRQCFCAARAAPLFAAMLQRMLAAPELRHAFRLGVLLDLREAGMMALFHEHAASVLCITHAVLRAAMPKSTASKGQNPQSPDGFRSYYFAADRRPMDA
jgi:hypothetical protein